MTKPHKLRVFPSTRSGHHLCHSSQDKPIVREQLRANGLNAEGRLARVRVRRTRRVGFVCFTGKIHG